jgi:hypothetical protein
MDVYLVPVGPDGYELYCEPHEGTVTDAADRQLEPEASRSWAWSWYPRWRSKMSRTFRMVLAYLDQERDRRAARRAARHRGTWLQRLRDRLTAWLAERVAEQRLLWRLRGVSGATAHFPDDCTSQQAAEIVRHSLRRDGARHGRWLAANTVGFCIAAPLSFVPGPNVILYYFIFRVVGHYLSWTGARQGTAGVRWAYQSCPPLTDLRRLPALPLTERAALAHAVAERLGLERIDTFAERMSRAGA